MKSDFDDDRSPSNHTLELKRYAQVMFVKNDPERRWGNGTIAKTEPLPQTERNRAEEESEKEDVIPDERLEFWRGITTIQKSE